MEELNYKYTYNAPYSPIYMGGIEDSWGLAKRIVAQERLNAILNNREFQMKKLIDYAMNSLCVFSISRSVSKSLKLLNIN